jgi:mannose-6-phosphate isomerase-like protein (cupin superfamily)
MTERVPLLEVGKLLAGLEDEPAPIRARAGDFVLGPKNRWHHIEPVGSEPSIRIAINARGEFHRYDRPGCKPL